VSVGAYPLAALAHLVLAVLVTGYALFWSIMALALRRVCSPAETETHLATVAAARWPHVVVPWRLRLPLRLLGWLLLAAATGSGLLVGALGGPRELGLPFWLKLAAVIAVLALHASLARRPRPVPAWLGLPLVLLVLVLSVPLVR
jgi:hypothetical protein